jgi:Tfp pilus assembly protein PilX
MEKTVALARTPEERVTALHRAAQLRRAMEAAEAAMAMEERRVRVAKASAERRGRKTAVDERWISS